MPHSLLLKRRTCGDLAIVPLPLSRSAPPPPMALNPAVLHTHRLRALHTVLHQRPGWPEPAVMFWGPRSRQNVSKPYSEALHGCNDRFAEISDCPVVQPGASSADTFPPPQNLVFLHPETQEACRRTAEVLSSHFEGVNRGTNLSAHGVAVHISRVGRLTPFAYSLEAVVADGKLIEILLTHWPFPDMNPYPLTVSGAFGRYVAPVGSSLPSQDPSELHISESLRALICLASSSPLAHHVRAPKAPAASYMGVLFGDPTALEWCSEAETVARPVQKPLRPRSKWRCAECKSANTPERRYAT